MLSTPLLKFYDFSGGLITSGSPISLGVNQTPDCLNVYSGTLKSIQRRLGYDKIDSSQSAESTGIYNYKRTDTVQYLLNLWGTTLKKMDVVTSAWDGTWDTVSKDPNKGTALSASILHVSTIGTDCIMTTEGRDVPQKYDPVDNVSYVDIDWETSHGNVVGDVTTYIATSGDKLKIVIDTTNTFDDIVLTGATTVAAVVVLINAVSGFAAKGLAYVDSSGYLVIMSNSRGTASKVNIADGATGNGGECEDLFSGTTITGTGITGAPSGRLNLVWHEMVWIANTSDNPDRLSYATDYTDWDALAYETISTSGDVGITAIDHLRGRMYVFKRNSIHRITYLGGTPLLDIKQVTSSVGTSSPRSIKHVEIPGVGEVLIFLGSDMQIYKFDGYNAVPISDNVFVYNGISNYCIIGDNTTYGINSAQLSKCHAVNYGKKHQYKLFFCLGDDTTASDAFVYDYFTNAIWPFHFANPFTASCISDNGAGQSVLYMTGTNYTWVFDSGNDDDGTAINGYWTSCKTDMGSEVQSKRIRFLHLTMDSVACTPYFYHKMDWESSWSVAETLAASTIEHTIDIPRFDEILQWKISDNTLNPPFNMIRATLSVDVSGVTK